MKKRLVLLLFFSLISMSFCSESMYRRRNTEPGGGDAAPQQGAATPQQGAAPQTPSKEIKFDKTAILLPELTPTMSNKPQIIIKRDGPATKSEANHLQLIANDPCTLRQGYVLVQTKVVEGINPILYAKPSFCVLNKKTISFFESENIHSLIASFELGSTITNSDENYWKKSNCVPLYKAATPVSSGTQKPTGPTPGKRAIIFCLEDELQTSDWINAVNTFHKCTLEEIQIRELSTPKIKTIIKRGEMATDDEINKDRAKEFGYADQSSESAAEEENKKESAELDRMTKQLMEEFRRHKELEYKEKLRLREERKRLGQKTSQFSAQAACIEQALEVKSIEDQKNLETLLDEMKLDKEKNLWKQAQKRLEYMWKKETESIHEQQSDLKKAEWEIKEKMKKELIQEASEWVKNLDPYDCYQNKLVGGNLAVMKQVCSNFFNYGEEPDLKKLLDCLNPKKFCQLCCSYYIGADDPTGNKLRCETQCKKVLNEEANAYNIQYELPAKPVITQTTQ